VILEKFLPAYPPLLLMLEGRKQTILSIIRITLFICGRSCFRKAEILKQKDSTGTDHMSNNLNICSSQKQRGRVSIFSVTLQTNFSVFTHFLRTKSKTKKKKKDELLSLIFHIKFSNTCKNQWGDILAELPIIANAFSSFPISFHRFAYFEARKDLSDQVS